MTDEERLVPCRHLDVGGHGWGSHLIGMRGLRQRDRKSYSESHGACDTLQATRGSIFRCIAVLHAVLLFARWARIAFAVDPGKPGLQFSLGRTCIRKTAPA
jgi:hypothetical protein